MKAFKMISAFLLLLFFSLFTQTVMAFQIVEDSESKVIQSIRMNAQEQSDFKFDGKLDESFWNSIPAASGFTQQAPIEGAAATEKTEVRIAFDDKNLYIGVILFDSEPDQIKAFQKRRDQRITADERFVDF